jgi:hypothetical protein
MICAPACGQRHRLNRCFPFGYEAMCREWRRMTVPEALPQDSRPRKAVRRQRVIEQQSVCHVDSCGFRCPTMTASAEPDRQSSRCTSSARSSTTSGPRFEGATVNARTTIGYARNIYTPRNYYIGWKQQLHSPQYLHPTRDTYIAAAEETYTHADVRGGLPSLAPTADFEQLERSVATTAIAVRAQGERSRQSSVNEHNSNDSGT